jgi:DNA-binding transcriptional LysR family regulator
MLEPSADLTVRELPHLGTFARAAELGSFTATGAELGMTQAAVSQRIAALERELGVSLFDRRSGRITLTEAGRRLYGYAREILDLHGQAREAVSGLHPPVSGDLPLATSSVPGEFFLPELLTGFHRAFPRVHVRATVGDSTTALQEVEKGQANLALVGDKMDAAHLEFRHLGADRLVLVVPRGHRWVDRHVPPSALAGEPLILRESGSGSRRAVIESLARAGVMMADLNVVLELGSNGAIKDAVGRGLGVAFLSRLAVRRELDSGDLVTVEVEGLDQVREFYLAYDRRRPLPPTARVFLHYLEANPLLPPAPGAAAHKPLL